MDKNLLFLLVIFGFSANFGLTDADPDVSSRLGFWAPLPNLPIVGSPATGVAANCPVCTEAACCSFMCPNGYICSATAGTAPQCMNIPPTGGPPTFLGSPACKRQNCDACTSTQISCSAVTRVCLATAMENVCQFNY